MRRCVSAYVRKNKEHRQKRASYREVYGDVIVHKISEMAEGQAPDRGRLSPPEADAGSAERGQRSQPTFMKFWFSGGYTGEDTPVPIPNTEVKLPRADGTCPVRGWESRSLPGLNKESPITKVVGDFFWSLQRPTLQGPKGR